MVNNRDILLIYQISGDCFVRRIAFNTVKTWYAGVEPITVAPASKDSSR